MILVAGPYRSGTNDDPVLIQKQEKIIFRDLEEVPTFDFAK